MTFPSFSSADVLAVVLFVLGGLVGWLISAIYYTKATKDLQRSSNIPLLISSVKYLARCGQVTQWMGFWRWLPLSRRS
jgi:uncharacterized membrane protein YciS (DUF1049 family)